MTTNAIDLSLYETMVIDYEHTETIDPSLFLIKASITKADDSGTVILSKNTTISRVYEEVDISSLTGNQYIKFAIDASGDGTGKLFKLILKK